MFKQKKWFLASPPKPFENLESVRAPTQGRKGRHMSGRQRQRRRELPLPRRILSLPLRQALPASQCVTVR